MHKHKYHLSTKWKTSSNIKGFNLQGLNVERTSESRLTNAIFAPDVQYVHTFKRTCRYTYVCMNKFMDNEEAKHVWQIIVDKDQSCPPTPVEYRRESRFLFCNLQKFYSTLKVKHQPWTHRLYALGSPPPGDLIAGLFLAPLSPAMIAIASMTCQNSSDVIDVDLV